MEHTPSSEANPFSANQEIPRILWNPTVHYRIHKCPPPILILTQLDPVHAPTSHFLKIHLNILFQSMLGSSKQSHSLRFPHLNPVYASPLPRTCYISRQSHSSRFDHRNNIGWGVQIIKLLHSSVTSSLLPPNIFLNTLFPNTLSLRRQEQAEVVINSKKGA